MTLKRQAWLVLLALAALAAGAGGASPAPARAPRRGPRVDPGIPPGTPIPSAPRGVLLGPGWYWYWLRDSERDQLAVWLDKHRGAVMVRKAMGSGAGEASVIILEVLEHVEWELPGLPAVAPSGIDTTIDQIEHSGSPQLSRMGRWIEGMRKQTEDVVRYYDQMFQQWLDSKLNPRPQQ